MSTFKSQTRFKILVKNYAWQLNWFVMQPQNYFDDFWYCIFTIFGLLGPKINDYPVMVTLCKCLVIVHVKRA